VLTKTRCPHTGVVNFFSAADPLLAVGSVSESATSAHCAWHCYLDTPTSGIAPDIEMAEARLRTAIAARRDTVAAGPGSL
jgi:hypothetical protein